MKIEIVLSLILCGSAMFCVGADEVKSGSQKGSSSGKVQLLIVGGGSSHDFERWFNKEDSATLGDLPNFTVRYTSKPAEVVPALPGLDVLYLSSNQPFDAPGLREGVFAFAQSGKGLLLIHPALWYNWKDWPEYNRVLAGGGARGHDKLGEFEVTVTETGHALMKDVPATFKITDELYYFQTNKEGTPLHILATGKSPISGKVFPVAWITKDPKARIFCLTLGHDGRAHELPAYKQMLQNAAQWAAKR